MRSIERANQQNAVIEGFGCLMVFKGRMLPQAFLNRVSRKLIAPHG